MAGVAGRSGGRNAKTVQAHALEGTGRKHRHAHASPEAPQGIPEPPKPMAGEAKEEWDRLCARLSTTKALSTVDGGAIYQYCCLFAETEHLSVQQEQAAASVEILEQNVPDLQGADLVACFQEITKLRRLEAQYSAQVRQGRMAQRIFLVEFGLTPASRGRVKLPDQGPKDEWAEFEADPQ